jgi:REP element-mobilizing transposase RayT
MQRYSEQRRRSIRLADYDYSRAAAYFVTICTQNRECLFGKIVEGKMELNTVGHMLQSVWEEIPRHYPGVATDEFVIMPNHVHGIIIIREDPVPKRRGGVPPLQKPVLGRIVAYYKYQTTKQIN